MSGSSAEAPTPVESDAPVAADATSVTQTGAPVEKGKEVTKEVEAEGDKLPEYKDEGVAPPPEKTEVVQGEEVKQPTEEVSTGVPRRLGQHSFAPLVADGLSRCLVPVAPG